MNIYVEWKNIYRPWTALSAIWQPLRFQISTSSSATVKRKTKYIFLLQPRMPTLSNLWKKVMYVHEQDFISDPLKQRVEKKKTWPTLKKVGIMHLEFSLEYRQELKKFKLHYSLPTSCNVKVCSWKTGLFIYSYTFSHWFSKEHLGKCLK